LQLKLKRIVAIETKNVLLQLKLKRIVAIETKTLIKITPL